MNPWFIWNDRISSEFGLWISKLPPITRPEERVQHITIPGRAGDLTLTQGDDVYNPYTKKITVTCVNEAITEDLLDWLRGDGDLIISTEDQFVYHARIVPEVSFTRLGNCLSQAVISFYCQPFKYQRYPANNLVITASAGAIITNPGNVSSRPKIWLTGTGENIAILFHDEANQMWFPHLPGSVEIDCDAGIVKTTAKAYDQVAYYYVGDYCIYQGGAEHEYAHGTYRFITEGLGRDTQWEYISDSVVAFDYSWPGAWYGDFPKIYPGRNGYSPTGNITRIEIEYRWRWI